MIVEDLIEKLKTMPPKARVMSWVVWGDGTEGLEEVAEAVLTDEGEVRLDAGL